MVTLGTSKAAMKSQGYLGYIVRGAIVGIIFSFIYNSRRWTCLSKQKVVELYKTTEPDIPEEYMRNLSTPYIPVAANRKFTLTPWQIENFLKDNPKDNYFMVFMIKTSVVDAKRRFNARSSWGSIGEIEGKRIGVIFVVGEGFNPGHNNLLKKENELYGDILQSNIQESAARSRVYLLLSGYQWCSENMWKRSQYFINVRDDIFPFLPNLYEYTMKIEERQQQNLLHCGFGIKWPRHKPVSPKEANYVERTQYNNSYFPSFCESDMVILSFDMLQNLFQTAIVTKVLPMSDVSLYVFGILREKLRKNQEMRERNFIRPNLQLGGQNSENNPAIAFRISFMSAKRSKGEKTQSEIHWDNTKSMFLFDDEVHKEESEKETTFRRKAKLRNIPTSDTKTTFDKDKKIFMAKWMRIPMRRS